MKRPLEDDPKEFRLAAGTRPARSIFASYCDANAKMGGDEEGLNLAHLHAKRHYAKVEVLAVLASFGVNIVRKDIFGRTLETPIGLHCTFK